MPDGDSILEQFDQWLNRYGYLSEAATGYCRSSLER